MTHRSKISVPVRLRRRPPKSIIKEIVLEFIFTVAVGMTIAVNIGNILHAYREITDFRKKVYI